MSQWPATQASRVLSALLRIGWRVPLNPFSPLLLQHDGLPGVVFAFHDRDEIGPRMLARLSKATGLTPDDL